VSNQQRRRRDGGRFRKGQGAARRVLSLNSGEGRHGGRRPEHARKRPAEMSRCYLHLLGEAEAALLKALRDQVPAAVATAREGCSAVPREGPLEIWGVDVEARSEASDIVLLKFLRAEDLDVQRAAKRLTETLQFRADSGLEALAREELPPHFQGHDAVEGSDLEGRPLMISRYGQMDNEKVFGDPDAFVRYRLQVMETAMAKLSLEAGAPEDLCQVHDYSGVSLLFKSDEVKGGIAAMTRVFSAHYPETKGKTIFVKFPTLFSKLFQAFSIFIPEKTRKKFIILGEADQALLFDHVPPEAVPEDMGGLLPAPGAQGRRLEGRCQATSVPARSSAVVDVAQLDAPATIAWELRVCSHDVAYTLSFAPADGGEEQLVSQSPPGEPLPASRGVLRGELRTSEPGVLRCRFDNSKSWFQQKLCLCRAECVA